jgi:PAS domain S-box-containing protein
MGPDQILILLLPLSSLSLAAILLVVYQQVRSEKIIHYWGLQWVLSAVTDLSAVAVLYGYHTYPAAFMWMLNILGSVRLSLIVAAGAAGRGRPQSRRFYLWLTAAAFAVLTAAWLYSAPLGALAKGPPKSSLSLTLAFGGALLACITGYFVWCVWTSERYRGGWNRAVIVSSVLLTAQQVLYSTSSLGWGPFAATQSNGQRVAALALRIALGFSLVISVLENALLDARRATELDRRLQRILEIVKLAAIVLDREGRILFANEYLLSTTGYTSSEVVGQEWYGMFAPEGERPERRRRYFDEISKGQIEVYHESVILTKAGGARQVNWANSLLRGPAGEIVGCASLGYDLTDQRRLEEQFQQAQRLESVGRLAGGVAHDFNNLLTVINGYSSLLLRQPLQESWRQQLTLIQKAGERGAALTRQLLAFSRRQVIDPKPTDLNIIVRDVVELLARTMGDDIHVETVLAGGLHAVLVDHDSFHQVLVNLAINARDAMPQGGCLTIETANATLDGESMTGNSEVAPGEYVALIVKDSGMGMDQETLQRVFEPFFTTKPAGKGTGLGLASVHGIVRQSRGWISVASEPGKGTTFRIYLPKLEGAERK